MNDIFAQIDFCRFHKYTDNVQLYLSDVPCRLDECIRRMNADLDRLYIWAAENGLCLNHQKFQAIVLGFQCSASFNGEYNNTFLYESDQLETDN
jgi:hypothetical protein